MIAALARRAGVDAGAFRVLLRTALLIDFRSNIQPGRKKSTHTSPLAFVLWMNLITSSFMTVMTVPALDAGTFALFHLSLVGVMMTMLTLNDFGLTFFDAGDLEVIGHTPIHPRTWFAAKICNVGFFVVVCGCAFSLVPAVAGAWTRGGGWWFPLLFLPMAILELAFVTTMLLFGYALAVRWVPVERVKNWFHYAQFAATLLLILGYQLLVHYLGDMAAWRPADAGAWLWLVPPAWFAAPITLAHGGWDAGVAARGGLALAVWAVTAWACLQRLAGTWHERMGASATVATAAPKTAAHESGLRAFGRLWRVQPGDEQAGYRWLARMTAHDRTVRMRIMGVMVMPAVMAVVYALQAGMANPFDGDSDAFMLHTVFVMFLLMLGMTPNILLHGSNPDASWTLYAAPIARWGAFHRGVKKAIWYRVALVPCVGLWAFFTWGWGPLDAALVVGLLVAESWLVLHLMSLWFYDVPLSREAETGQRAAALLSMFLVLPLSCGLAALHVALAFSRPITALAIVLVAVIARAVGRGAAARADRKAPVHRGMPA